MNSKDFKTLCLHDGCQRTIFGFDGLSTLTFIQKARNPIQIKDWYYPNLVMDNLG